MWKIERRGRTVRVWWGPATVEKRKIAKAASLQTKSWTHSTIDDAKADEDRRIQEKLKGGYSKKVPSKPAR
jgi:hypothetical protein